MSTEKVCAFCGQPFAAAHHRARFCSPECARKAKIVHDVAYMKEKRARAKAARTVEKVCACCGKTFATSNAKKVYCSYACQHGHQLALHRQAHAEAAAKSPKVCPWCGKTFIAATAKKRFCSYACSDAAYKAAHREEHNAEMRRLRARKAKRPDRSKRSGSISAGGLTDAQRARVEADLRIVYPEVRYKHSLKWTHAMRCYARRLYLEQHPLRAGCCTILH